MSYDAYSIPALSGSDLEGQKEWDLNTSFGDSLFVTIEVGFGYAGVDTQVSSLYFSVYLKFSIKT
jgi:hypothetical protein